MDNNTLIIWAVIAFLVGMLFVFSFKTGKSKKLRITTSEPDATGQLKILEVTRKWNDGWEDSKDMKCYHLEGKKIWLATHWIIRVEEM
jgi:hypothetical protein